MTLRELEIDKPDDLIFSPMRISQAAVYIINAIILNERLGPMLFTLSGKTPMMTTPR